MKKKYPNYKTKKKYEYGGKDGKSISSAGEGYDVAGMLSGVASLPGQIGDTIDAFKTGSTADKASTTLSTAGTVAGAIPVIGKFAKPILDLGAGIANLFDKEDTPDLPKKFTSQNYAQGNFKQGGATAKGISIAAFNGGMTRLHSSPEVDIYQTAGNRHSTKDPKTGLTGITTKDGKVEYETGETYLKFKDGGYFLPRQAAKSFNSKIKNMQQGPMTAGKEFTIKYMMEQAIKSNEALLPLNKQMNFALGGSTPPQQVTLSPNSFQKLAANKPTMTPAEFQAHLQKTGNTHLKTYTAGTPNKGAEVKAAGGYTQNNKRLQRQAQPFNADNLWMMNDNNQNIMSTPAYNSPVNGDIINSEWRQNKIQQDKKINEYLFRNPEDWKREFIEDTKGTLMKKGGATKKYKKGGYYK